MPWNMTEEEQAEWRLASAERRLASYQASRDRAEREGRRLVVAAFDLRILAARGDVERYQAALDARNAPVMPPEPIATVRVHPKWHQSGKAA